MSSNTRTLRRASGHVDRHPRRPRRAAGRGGDRVPRRLDCPHPLGSNGRPTSATGSLLLLAGSSIVATVRSSRSIATASMGRPRAGRSRSSQPWSAPSSGLNATAGTPDEDGERLFEPRRNNGPGRQRFVIKPTQQHERQADQESPTETKDAKPTGQHPSPLSIRQVGIQQRRSVSCVRPIRRRRSEGRTRGALGMAGTRCGWFRLWAASRACRRSDEHDGCRRTLAALA